MLLCLLPSSYLLYFLPFSSFSPLFLFSMVLFLFILTEQCLSPNSYKHPVAFRPLSNHYYSFSFFPALFLVFCCCCGLDEVVIVLYFHSGSVHSFGLLWSLLHGGSPVLPVSFPCSSVLLSASYMFLCVRWLFQMLYPPLFFPYSPVFSFLHYSISFMMCINWVSFSISLFISMLFPLYYSCLVQCWSLPPSSWPVCVFFFVSVITVLFVVLYYAISIGYAFLSCLVNCLFLFICDEFFFIVSLSPPPPFLSSLPQLWTKTIYYWRSSFPSSPSSIYCMYPYFLFIPL